MSYDQGDFDHDSGSGFGPYQAEVINAGVGIGKYGPEYVFVCKPTNPNRRSQTLHMGIGKGDFKFGGAKQVITTGEGEKAWDVTVYEEIVSGPKIKVITKGGLFLNALKHLGFKIQGGDVTIYIGLILDLEEIKSTEAIRRFNEIHQDSPLEAFGDDYKITIPTKIISMPEKKIPLEEHIKNFIDKGKTENEVIAWCDENSISKKDAFGNLDAQTEDGRIVFDGKTYMVKKGDK